MEAVAAAASIAGIITVVGQSIDGLIKFSDFFSDISSASKTISRLLSDINSLIRTLEEIGNVLEQAQARRKGQNLASLDIKLEDCARDVQLWLATARLLRPGGSDSGGKAWLRKFRLAVNSTAIQTIREEIGRHKQTLCLSLEVFGRTIDIDTAVQVHQIGGRVSEALSTSLSVHGAHEEALRRIEHYSMTSMHSSAHSIRSMDSIRTEFRTELSRLEAMISNTSNALPSGVETGESQNDPDFSPTVRQPSAIAETGNGVLYPPVSDLLPEHKHESPTTTGPVIELATQGDPSNLALNEVIGGAQPPQVGEMAAGNRTKIELRMHSKGKGTSMGIIDEEGPAKEVNKVSDLYAEFSKNLEPRRTESSAIEIDSAAIHDSLRQSLAGIYPPEVVKYISLRQVTTLCEDHIDFLDRKPSVQPPVVGSIGERSDVDSVPRAAARPFAELRIRLVELRKAIRVSRKQCVQAGYTLFELDKFLSPPGTGSYSPADRPPRRSAMDSGDDSSGIYSEEFYSTAE